MLNVVLKQKYKLLMYTIAPEVPLTIRVRMGDSDVLELIIKKQRVINVTQTDAGSMHLI